MTIVKLVESLLGSCVLHQPNGRVALACRSVLQPRHAHARPTNELSQMILLKKCKTD